MAFQRPCSRRLMSTSTVGRAGEGRSRGWCARRRATGDERIADQIAGLAVRRSYTCSTGGSCRASARPSARAGPPTAPRMAEQFLLEIIADDAVRRGLERQGGEMRGGDRSSR